MHLEINGNLKQISLDDIKKDFPEVGDPQRLYVFKYAPGVITDDPNNPRRKVVPGRPLQNFFNTFWRKTTAKIQYYKTKYEKGPGMPPVYSPEYILFDSTGQIIVDLTEDAPPASKDISLVYFLLANPKRGKGHYVLEDREQVSAENVARAKNKSMATAIVSWPAAPGYITDDQLVRAAKLLQIPNSESLKPHQIREVLHTRAEMDPEDFMKRLNSEKVKEISILQDALDTKVIHYDPDTRGYFYTYREDPQNIFSKVTAETPFHQVPVTKLGKHFESLVEFVTLNMEMLPTLDRLVKEELAVLNSYPGRGKKSAAELVTKVNVAMTQRA